MVCVGFSLMAYDPKVSHLLAGIAMSIADEEKDLWLCGDGLKNDCIDYSVRTKLSLTSLISPKKGAYNIVKF